MSEKIFSDFLESFTKDIEEYKKNINDILKNFKKELTAIEKQQKKIMAKAQYKNANKKDQKKQLASTNKQINQIKRTHKQTTKKIFLMYDKTAEKNEKKLLTIKDKLITRISEIIDKKISKAIEAEEKPNKTVTKLNKEYQQEVKRINKLYDKYNNKMQKKMNVITELKSNIELEEEPEQEEQEQEAKEPKQAFEQEQEAEEEEEKPKQAFEQEQEAEEEEEQVLPHPNIDKRNILDDPNKYIRLDKPKEKQIISHTNFKFVSKYTIYDPNVNNVQEYINSIQQTIQELGEPVMYVILLFSDPTKGKNGIRNYTVKLDDIQNLARFKEIIEEITTGQYVNGSDPVYYNNGLRLITTHYRLIVANPLAEGKSEYMIFENENIKSKEGLCGYESLKMCGYDHEGDKNELKKLDNIIKIIKNKDLKIDIICNSLSIKTGNNDIRTVMKGKNIEKVIDKKKYVCKKIDITKIEPIYIYKTDQNKHTLIYDEVEKHIDVIKNNEIKFCDNMLMTNNFCIVKDDKIVLTWRELNINRLKKTNNNPINTKYLFFDYETVIDFKEDNIMRPYSLSIAVFDELTLGKLNEYDQENNINECEKIRAETCITFSGFDCNEQFIKWFAQNTQGIKYIFIGFNNSNFDNLLLADHLLKKNIDDEVYINDVFYSNGGILNMRINKLHSCFDIRKHLTGTLDACCKSFKINCCRKRKFDHEQAQEMFMTSKNNFIKYVTTDKELKEYNEYDVLATALLYVKYKNVLNNIPILKDLILHEKPTIGGIIYDIFEKNKQKNNYDFPLLNLQQYTDMQKYKIAGRVELFNGVQKIENERISSLDVCSLYPYVMAIYNGFEGDQGYYPAGDIKEVDEYQGDDILGFYYCDIDQSNLKSQNLPLIYAEKTGSENKWDTENVLDNYLISNVMIKLLLENRCKVNIKKGFIFTQKIKGCELFKFILDFMDIKNQQDILKESKDANYNPVLRETVKLLMNAMSGKVIEGLHTEKNKFVQNYAEYAKIKEKATEINCIDIVGDKALINYKVSEESLLKDQRPIYHGVFIYDYAKTYMYNASYKPYGLNNLIYTDTDATKAKHDVFIKWAENIKNKNILVPHWPEIEKVVPIYKTHLLYEDHSKIFGSFENELKNIISKDGKSIFYVLQKKSWGYFCGDKEEYRFKGVSDKNIILNLDEPFIKTKTINHKNGDKETKYIIKDGTDEELREFINKNANKCVSKNAHELFEKLYNDKEAYILSSTFKKITGNNKKGADYEHLDRLNRDVNKIKNVYMIKHITIDA